jgi:hypothetical protein
MSSSTTVCSMCTSMPLVDAVVLQRADHLQPGAVAHVGQPRVAVAAEVALQDAAVGVRSNRAPQASSSGRARGPPWRAARPCASCSGTGRRAWCRRSGRASCRARRRWPSPPPCRPRPSRCGPCPAGLADDPDLGTPALEASMAARRPAPPAPMTSTSYSKVSGPGMAV